ncbi:MAG: transcription antitermination factor NusB [Phycisphaeraceae bacterium]|nr:transcription antitermination factor NusB [Phycisphaeraceae bacterium]MCW5754300.1 transcription antitermination factor NusB [Phycisphaeraceae bacterium]
MSVRREVRELAYEHLYALDDRLGMRRPVFETMAMEGLLTPDERLIAHSIAARKLAMQMLYQLDQQPVARQPTGAQQDVLSTLGQVDDLGPMQFERVAELVLRAYRTRHESDLAMERLAPTWPASRQPAIDRAILRMSHAELVEASTPARVVVNEAVELAKRFSTERSPTFINGLLGKLMPREAARGDAIESGNRDQDKPKPPV